MTVKIALLLHDIGKPFCYTEDENGGHFYGHAPICAEIADRVLRRMRFDNQTIHDAVELISVHDATLEPTKRVVRRMLNKIGPEQFARLLEVRLADINAHAEGTQESRLKRVHELRALFTEAMEQRECFSIKDLAVNGKDIMALGVPEGREVGGLLNLCLSAVISEEIKNDHDALIRLTLEHLRADAGC